MKRDEAELLIHRTLSEWLKSRSTILINLADYLELVELLTFVVMEDSHTPQDKAVIPVTNIVAPENGVYCDICNSFVPAVHMWSKHRMKRQSDGTYAPYVKKGKSNE